MSIKSNIKKIPLVEKAHKKVLFEREYKYDKKFFKKNFSHSDETKNKLGYNMLLISHSLEKGMSNKAPRRFGAAKVTELIKMVKRYASFSDHDKDFAFVNSINVLRGYVSFYDLKGWGDAEERKTVAEFLESYKAIEIMNVGGYELNKKDFEKDANIDYKKFLASRHSVREFLPKPVKEADIKKAVEMAVLSPSACNRQMCKVYYVTDKVKAKKIIEKGQGFGGFEKDTINPIVVTFDVNANYFVGERNQGWFNAGLFSMNLVNAMHSMGIGSCFCQFGNSYKHEEQIKKMLGTAESERIAVIIACGYYADKCLIPYSPRKKIDDIYRSVDN